MEGKWSDSNSSGEIIDSGIAVPIITAAVDSLDSYGMNVPSLSHCSSPGMKGRGVGV